jgi:hypothetical protein
MSEESTRVLTMLAEGKLTVEQANQLIEALGEERRSTAEPWRSQGSQPAQARPVKSRAASKQLKPDQLIEMKIHGLNPELVREMREVGYGDLSAGQLMEFSIHGVRPEFVREMREIGYTDLTPEQLIELSIHGVNPEFVRQMHELDAELQDATDEDE